MIKITTLDNPRIAQAFVDYCALKNIALNMQIKNLDQIELWLEDETQAKMVQHEFEQFKQDPTQEKYQAASWDMLDSSNPQFSYKTPNFIALIKERAGPLTLGIMLICIIIYILQISGFGSAIFSLLHFPSQVDEKWQLWRWISHAFLHFSIMHISFNLLWWWDLGGMIEKKIGRFKLIQLFIFSAVVSGYIQYSVTGANFGGLSGVVYALLGYTWFVSIFSPEKGLSIQKPIVIFMLAWIALGYIQPFMPIANSAHLGGLIAGCIVALFDKLTTKKIKLNSN